MSDDPDLVVLRRIHLGGQPGRPPSPAVAPIEAAAAAWRTRRAGWLAGAAACGVLSVLWTIGLP